MPQRAAPMPKPAIDFIFRFIDVMALFAAIKLGDNGDHLLMAKSRLGNKLIVAHAGIVLTHVNNAVEYILAVIASI